MRTEVDDKLRAEANRFRLRFSCVDCAHFDPEQARCGEGYPTDAHRSIRRDLPVLKCLFFCKSFELV